MPANDTYKRKKKKAQLDELLCLGYDVRVRNCAKSALRLVSPPARVITPINTMFNTGTVVGFSSNVLGGGFPLKAAPSFAWDGAEDMTTNELHRAVEVARKAMARRHHDMSIVEEELFRAIFEMTVLERSEAGAGPLG